MTEELMRLTAEGDVEDEVLMRQLLDDLSPLFMQPYNPADSHLLVHGPTFDDSEAASAMSYQSENDRVLMVERSCLSKGNHEIDKFSLRIKNSGSVLADDGYKWRKYGQKSIKNSPNPRSYYRCTNLRCSAKKLVEKSIEDPETLIITYQGLHLHYTYPFLFLNNQHHLSGPPIKKQKGPISAPKDQYQAQEFEAQTLNRTEKVADSSPLTDPSREWEQELMGQGMLEDVVPLMIRQPASSHSSSSASQPSSPASSNSFSWSPTSSYLGCI